MIDLLKDRVQLEGMLTALAGAMLLAGRTNREFKEALQGRFGIAEIRTQDRCVARRFYISHGGLRVARGTHPSPDYAIVYKDASAALDILKKGSQEAVMQGITEGNMQFEGDMVFGMWFNELLQKIGALLKNPRELLPL